MRNFFHGWRRKAGVATLMMACLATGMLIRSTAVVDVISIPFGTERQTVIWSIDGRAHWFGVNVIGPKWRLQMGDKWSRDLSHALDQMRTVKRFPSTEYREWRIPYLPFAVCLTLISAYLILWKPRKRVAPRISAESSSGPTTE